MIRLRATVAYDGTDFCGWQIQDGQRTVQGEFEAAVSRIMDAPIRVHGSGRTDSGVHAMGQTAHFDIPGERKDVPWRRALNAILPRDVSVLDIREAAPDFHSRFSALSKTYSYTLWLEREFIHPRRRFFVWDCGPLDLAAMDRAAQEFMGSHDFKSFQNAGTPVRDTVRTILDFSRSSASGPEVVWTVRADGFLKQMVRNMVGCLVEAGRGKVSPESVRSILDERDRSAAPATAPARGLCLERVHYGETDFERSGVEF